MRKNEVGIQTKESEVQKRWAGGRLVTLIAIQIARHLRHSTRLAAIVTAAARLKFEYPGRGSFGRMPVQLVATLIDRRRVKLPYEK